MKLERNPTVKRRANINHYFITETFDLFKIKNADRLSYFKGIKEKYLVPG